MNRIAESIGIFRSLTGVQKFVIARIFAVEAIAVIVLQLRHWSDDANVTIGFQSLTLGAVLAFATWLGYMRGRQYHQVDLGSTGFQMRAVKMWPWYVGFFVLGAAYWACMIFAIGWIVIHGGAIPQPLAHVVLYGIEGGLLALTLLQGLRLGCLSILAPSSASTMSLGAVHAQMPPSMASADATGGAAGAPNAPIYQLRQSHLRRWIQVIFGGIAIICAIIALTSFIRSREPTQLSAADKQEDDALIKAMSEPVTVPTPAGSDSAEAAPVSATTAQAPARAQAQVPSPSPAAQRQAPSLTSNTFGNVVASYFPGESTQDALMDGLSKINSSLSVDSIDYLGYPTYSLECEKNGQCVNGTGTPFGSVADNAKEMFPVNPSDIQQYGLKCSVICYDSQGQIIGRAP